MTTEVTEYSAGELIALAVLAASPVAVMVMPVAVMVMPVPTHRAVKHLALLGAECLIERFERWLRCL